MTSSFRKFIHILISVILGWLTSWSLVNYSYDSQGGSFVPLEVFIIPIGLVCAIIYYSLLRGVFRVNDASNINSQSQRKVVVFSLLFILIVVSLYLGLRVLENHQKILDEQAIQNIYKEQEEFLKNHCTRSEQNSRVDSRRPVYTCDDGTIR